jgi:hypothetical protein
LLYERFETSSAVDGLAGALFLRRAWSASTKSRDHAAVEGFQRRVSELRFVEGIEKVEHVPYPSGDEFWVRFNEPLDLKKLDDLTGKHGWRMIKFGGLPSKLPKPLGEVMWDGVSHVIVKTASAWGKFTASLGFEPDGIAKIATDAHGPYQIFIATQEDGVQLLYEYLGLKYVPPAPPPKPVVPAKPPAAPAVKPPAPAAKSASPPTPVAAKPPIPAAVSPPKSADDKMPSKS